MGLCGGSKHQKRAARAEAAKAKTDVGDGQPCPLGKCHLRVTVARADTGEGVQNVTVQAKGPTSASKTTAADTGLADFGVVDPGQYAITVKLGATEAKKYQAPAAVSLTIAKGDTKARRIELAPLVKLRFVLVDKAGSGLAAVEWKLDKPAKNGKTAADGLIEVDDAWDCDDDRQLHIKLPAPAAPPAPPAPAPAPAVVPPPYPPSIDPAQFADEAPGALVPEVEVDWKLSVADLADGDSDDGVKARLNNLGFTVDGKARTTVSIKTYQRIYLNLDAGSGTPADILADIKTRHDKSP
jgi:hypothetical protein